MRLRQLALVARDLDASVGALCEGLGIEVAFRDPGVAVFGLRNAVMPLGDGFLEVVSPVRDDAPAARYLARHGGDGGYMVMLHTADLAADRARLAARGVRSVWSAELDDIASVHLHPKDTGGAILSLDQPEPAEAWRWAGPAWREHVRRDTSRALAGAVLASPGAEGLARRWSELLDLPLAAGPDGLEIPLAPGVLRFEAGPVERLVGLEVEAADRERAGQRSRLAGVEVRWV